METFCEWNPLVISEFPSQRRALIFSLICTWTNDWANNWGAGDLRCHCTHYDVNVMNVNPHTCKDGLYIEMEALLYNHNKAMHDRTMCLFYGIHYIDKLVQERRNSSASAMELRLSCADPLTGLILGLRPANKRRRYKPRISPDWSELLN